MELTTAINAKFQNVWSSISLYPVHLLHDMQAYYCYFQHTVHSEQFSLKHTVKIQTAVTIGTFLDCFLGVLFGHVSKKFYWEVWCGCISHFKLAFSKCTIQIFVEYWLTSTDECPDGTMKKTMTFAASPVHS
jgi:hypothetical protein